MAPLRGLGRRKNSSLTENLPFEALHRLLHLCMIFFWSVYIFEFATLDLIVKL